MRMLRVLLLPMVLFAGTACGVLKVAPVDMSGPALVAMVDDEDVGKVYIAPGVDLRAYEVLVIRSPELGAALPMKGMDPEQMAIYLKGAFVKRLAATRVFGNVTDDPATLGNRSDKILVLESRFSELDPGSRALRYFVGWGAGRTKVQIESELKEAASQRVVLKASDRRVAAVGGFGGDSMAFIRESLDDVAKGYAKVVTRVASRNQTAPSR